MKIKKEINTTGKNKFSSGEVIKKNLFFSLNSKIISLIESKEFNALSKLNSKILALGNFLKNLKK